MEEDRLTILSIEKTGFATKEGNIITIILHTHGQSHYAVIKYLEKWIDWIMLMFESEDNIPLREKSFSNINHSELFRLLVEIAEKILHFSQNGTVKCEVYPAGKEGLKAGVYRGEAVLTFPLTWDTRKVAWKEINIKADYC